MSGEEDSPSPLLTQIRPTTMTELKKRKKYGGRTKGTPNKVTADMRATIKSLLDEYSGSGKMTDDFGRLEPKERLAVAEKLMQYAIPKLQATTLEVSEGATKTIEDTLLELSRLSDG